MSEYDLRDGDVVQKLNFSPRKLRGEKDARNKIMKARLAMGTCHPAYILTHNGVMSTIPDSGGLNGRSDLRHPTTKKWRTDTFYQSIYRPIKIWWANDVAEHPNNMAVMLLEAIKLGADKDQLADWNIFKNFKLAWPEMAEIILATEPDPKPKKT